MSPDGIRILVVDDAAEVAHGTSRVLEQAGYPTAMALSGEEAWQSIRARRPDLVLLDRDMPGVDGMEVCRQIKRDPALADVFVVLISGTYTLSEEQADGLESGADGYIVRPIANRELVARVEAFVRILRLTRSVQEQARSIQASNEELRRFNQHMVGRELRMIELKREINELCGQAGQPPRYPVDSDSPPAQP